MGASDQDDYYAVTAPAQMRSLINRAYESLVLNEGIILIVMDDAGTELSRGSGSKVFRSIKANNATNVSPVGVGPLISVSHNSTSGSFSSAVRHRNGGGRRTPG